MGPGIRATVIRATVIQATAIQATAIQATAIRATVIQATAIQETVGTMDLAGDLPQFDVTISGNGSAGTITWSSGNFVVTPPDVVHVEYPIPMDVEYQWVGIEGELELSP